MKESPKVYKIDVRMMPQRKLLTLNRHVLIDGTDAFFNDALPAYDALGRWTQDNGRQPAGAIRQLLIADQRTATPDTMTCDLSVPLKESP